MNIPHQFPSKSAIPWHPATHADSGGEKDSWVTTYMDVVTLMLTIFVLLVAYQMHAQTNPQSSQTTQTEQTTTEQTAPTALATEAEAAPATLSTRIDAPKEPQMQHKVAAAAGDVENRTDTPPTQTEPAAMTADAAWTEQQSSEISPQTPAPHRPYTPADISKLEIALKTVLGEDTPAISVQPNGFTVPLNEQILFARGSAAISDQGEQLLHNLAPTFAQFDGEIFVEGHTDNVPIATAVFPSNWELSTHRATSVTRLLIEFGLPASRLRAVGFGDTQPIADNQTAEGRAANRRVSLVFRLPTPAQL